MTRFGIARLAKSRLGAIRHLATPHGRCDWYTQCNAGTEAAAHPQRDHPLQRCIRGTAPTSNAGFDFAIRLKPRPMTARGAPVRDAAGPIIQSGSIRLAIPLNHHCSCDDVMPRSSAAIEERPDVTYEQYGQRHNGDDISNQVLPPTCFLAARLVDYFCAE